MFDNYSTDNSVEIANKLGIEVRTFGEKGVLNDLHYLEVKNSCWKEQRGKNVDYVIVVDADEFLHPDLRFNRMGTAPKVTGYNMVSDGLPVNDIAEIKTGVYALNYCKQAIFSPDAITEINYSFGCHTNNIQGRITTKGNCKLLHYRNIGGMQRLLSRHNQYKERISEFNKTHSLGIHYEFTDMQKVNEFVNLRNNAKIIS